jgi:tRNA 2-thiouridine synthesizing protein A
VETFDYRGLKCPLPALFAKRVLSRTPRGIEIEVITDDPLAQIDLPHMCRQESFECVSIRRDGAVTHLILKRPILDLREADPDAQEHPSH